jgi:hypothetical protein
MAHTPAPWVFLEFGNYGVIAGAEEDSPSICDIARNQTIKHADKRRVDSYGMSEQDKANAKLIAAAPELLDALSLLVSIFDSKNAGTNVDGKWMGIPDWDQVDIARAAIAKARSAA